MFRLDPHRDSIGAGVARRPEMARKRGQVLKIDNPIPVKIAAGIIGTGRKRTREDRQVRETHLPIGVNVRHSSRKGWGRPG